MLKVVIADDEARVCRLVQMLADWQALDMQVVDTASNGLEALERVEIHRPDHPHYGYPYARLRRTGTY